jgi:hypothetical protein
MRITSVKIREICGQRKKDVKIWNMCYSISETVTVCFKNSSELTSSNFVS